MELVFSSPKWLTQPLPLKKFESLKSKRGRETLRRKGKGSGKSLGLIGNARYEGETSPLLPFPPNPSSVCAPLHRCSLPCVMLSPHFPNFSYRVYLLHPFPSPLSPAVDLTHLQRDSSAASHGSPQPHRNNAHKDGMPVLPLSLHPKRPGATCRHSQQGVPSLWLIWRSQEGRWLCLCFAA